MSIMMKIWTTNVNFLFFQTQKFYKEMKFYTQKNRWIERYPVHELFQHKWGSTLTISKGDYLTFFYHPDKSKIQQISQPNFYNLSWLIIFRVIFALHLRAYDSFTVAGTVVQVNYLTIKGTWWEVESMHDDGVSASRAKWKRERPCRLSAGGRN